MNTRKTAVAVLLALSAAVGGCDGFARMIGAPTSEDYKALEAKATEAEKALVESDEKAAELEAAVAKADKAKAASESRVSALRSAQSEIAVQLAAADGDLRDALTAAMRRIDRDIEAEKSTAAGIGAALADAEERLAKLESARNRAVAQLDEAVETIGELDQAAKDAVAKAVGGINGLADAAGKLGVPGASVVAQTVTSGIAPFLLGALPTATAAWRYRRQRNGGRKAIATTERYGIEAIANDPTTRARAKADLSSDPVARREFALAKAGA